MLGESLLSPSIPTGDLIDGYPASDIPLTGSRAMISGYSRYPPSSVLQADPRLTAGYPAPPGFPYGYQSRRHTRPYFGSGYGKVRWLVIPAISLRRTGRLEPVHYLSCVAKFRAEIPPSILDAARSGEDERLVNGIARPQQNSATTPIAGIGRRLTAHHIQASVQLLFTTTTDGW